MRRFVLPFLFLLCATPAWSAPITKLKELTKRANVNKEPLRVIYGVDPSDPSKVIAILIDGTGRIVTVVGAVPPGAATEPKQDDTIAQLVLILAKLSADPSTETTLASVLAKLSSDPSTQTTAAAILAKLSSDPSTETTLAAVLAKLSSDPSTATLQAAANALLTTIDADTAAMVLSLASLDAKDFSTEVTSAAILAKMLAAPSSEAKQDDAIAQLALILAKLSADPSTATLQTAANVILATIDAVQDLLLLDTTEIIANTATATTGANGTVTITTTATEIRPANADRLSLLVHNAENVIVFTGFTGVTVAGGTPLSKSTTDADGKGGNITYKNTLAIFGIVTSGTADVRWTEESK